ncbi:MAG TPA: hypothetical protein VIY66_01485 [Candidatus Acidoferrales bacterium]
MSEPSADCWLEARGHGADEPGRDLGRSVTHTKSIGRAIWRARTWVGVLSVLIACSAARAQDQPPSPPKQQSPPAQQSPPVVVSIEQEQTQENPNAPCIQPPPVVRWQDYQGPFAKVVGAFGRKLERKSAVPPHYKPGAKLCTLEIKDKFRLFVDDTIDPITFLNAAFNAGLGQAQNSDPSFGQGAEGYGRRFGVNMIDQAQSEFFKDFAYPTIFFEDPRYYRLGQGSTERRLLHALAHAVVAHHEDGTPMPNYSEWLGTASAVALSNAYHPDNRRGFGPSAENVVVAVSEDAGFDVLREFWPEIARKFKLPFRGEDGGSKSGAASDK